MSPLRGRAPAGRGGLEIRGPGNRCFGVSTSGEKGPSGSSETGEAFRWRDFLSWDAEAAQLASEAHNRTTTPLRSPAIVWSFAVWPKRVAIDPLTADSPDEFTARQRRWAERINTVIRLFADPSFKGDLGDSPETFGVAVDDFLDDDSEREVEALRIRKPSCSFQILWRGVPGSVQVESHQEFARFTFVLAAHQHQFRPYLTGTRLERPLLREAANGETLSKFRAALQTLAEPDDAAPDKEARIDAVHAAQRYLYEDIWEAFSADMIDAARRRGGGALAETGRLIPGQAFSSLRGVTLRIDDAWMGDDPRLPAAEGMSPAQANEVLEARRLSIGSAFPEGRDREFVGGLLLGGQAVFVSTFGSSVPDQIANGSAALYRFEEGYLPASRYMLLLDRRPDSGQLGRLLERIHSVETFRLAALRNLKEVRDAADEIRFFGLKLDRLNAADYQGQRDLLDEILARLRAQAQAVRGGLSYRISRSELYASEYRSRLAELRSKQIEGWQPYQDFFERRTAHTYEMISSVKALRSALMDRVQLLLERLQWHELTEVQRDAQSTLKSTDSIAYVATVFGSAALGVEIGPALQEWAPVTSAAVRLPGLGAEGEQAWFGFVFGIFTGAVLTFLIYLLRNVTRRKGGVQIGVGRARSSVSAVNALLAVIVVVVSERLGGLFASLSPSWFQWFADAAGLVGDQARTSAYGAALGLCAVLIYFATRAGLSLLQRQREGS